MGPLVLSAALAAFSFAGDVIPTSKVAAKKTSPARRVYDYVLTAGFRSEMPPTGPGWDGRKVWDMQAPNDITVQAYATNDAGLPMCEVRAAGREGKIAEALKMGLPVPVLLIDRGCTGQVKDVRAYSTATPEAESSVRMTQRQLDIFFGLMEDCFKNGL